MTLVEGEELQRLWALVSELSNQLSANRQVCQSLQAQADELKGQALHTGTGYTLRRFNLDISKEKFESDLEKLNSQLVVENQSLSHENKQMNMLLREYENTLESVMAKFRSFSHATQQHTLSLTSHYETLLASDAHRTESTALHESTSFSNTLAHLGGLVRLALREVEGEGVDSDEEGGEADPFEAEGYRVGSPSGIGPSPHGETSASKNTGKKSKLAYGSAPSRDPRWYGTGGYTGFQGDPDAEKAEQALQARTEEERLRQENETLRELLRISADISPEVAQEFGIEVPAPAASSSWSGAGLGTGKLSLGKARGSRKSLSAEVKAGIKAEESEPLVVSIEEDDTGKRQSREGAETFASAESTSSLSSPPRDPLSVESDNAKESSSSSNSILSPSKVVPEHVLGGAGASPQLLAMINDDEMKKDSGIIVTSPVAQEEEVETVQAKPEATPIDTGVHLEESASPEGGIGLGLDHMGTQETQNVGEGEKSDAHHEPITTSDTEVDRRDTMLDDAEQAIARATEPASDNE
ncbi:hypothetical protein CBS101457_006744 [Exobasidium rhododendri]|nr:hypothetical protein CBS101457_006744 [Exobasidium rhododendri]